MAKKLVAWRKQLQGIFLLTKLKDCPGITCSVPIVDKLCSSFAEHTKNH